MIIEESIKEKPVLKIKSDIFSEIFTLKNGLPIFKAYINGKWVETEKKRDIYSPIDGSVIAGMYELSQDESLNALRSLYEKGRWDARNTPGSKRLEILERLADLIEDHKEEFINALIINSGKPIKAAKGEVEASIDRLRRAPLDLRKLPGDYIPGDWDEHTLESEGIVRREPFGVVFAIIPFNYPLFDSVNKMVYSFLPGNAIAIKPPSSDPLPIILMVKLAIEAGFPKNAITLLTIPGRVAGELASSKYVNVISLTGSTETGIKLIQKAGIKQYIMELGGGDPAIVLEDADLDLSASKIATGIASYTGQRCDSIKLILAEEPVYDELKKKIAIKLTEFKVGDPRDPSVDLGPVIDKSTADEWEEAIKEALENGGKLLAGGRRIGERYIEPALIEIRDHEILQNLKLYKEEVFASVALITPVKDIDEAIELANKRRYGLDAAVFGKDLNKIRKLVRLLEVGAIYINEYPRHGVGYYPFGGRKDSGIGREGIGYSIEQVTALKTIVYNYKGYGIWEYM
ncbi:MAG: NADP-dependent glyceraldehyde-3-phosphate dehydrogenase [Desulfurococcales archaeon]|nr:NADP-dependent glyceraldehyde-3-phosphate dehydrogenase [Desulfurococcales archaeon]